MIEKHGVKMDRKDRNKKYQLWISKGKKEIFLSEVKQYECMEFKQYEQLMEFVRACIDCGYKVG